MATTTASSSSKARIRASLAQWQGAIPEPHQALFAKFVDETLSRLRGPFLAHHRPTAVLALLEEAFLFALHRPPSAVHAEVRRHPKGIAALVNMPDQPFIVDTVRLFLRTRTADYQGGFNLVLDAHRDASGALVDVGAGGSAESLVLLEADAGSTNGDLTAASRLLQLNLEHAQAMVSDFPAMTRTVERFAERCEVLAERRPDQADAMRETSAFLKWMLNENFVLFGVDGGAEPLGIQTLPGPYHDNSEGAWPPPPPPHTVKVRKSHIESPVHRSGRIDEILLTVGEPSDPLAMQLFVRGMFTYRAVTQPSRNVPILRTMLGQILSEQTASPGSHRYKGIANVFDSLPTEFLFTATKEAVAEMVDLVFEAEQQQEVGVTFMMSAQDSAFCLVAMPKTRYDDELRRSLESEIVSTTKATYADHGVFVGRYDTVLLHYYLTGVQYPGEQEVQRLTDLVRKQATPWGARLWNALSERFGDAQADRLADTYARAFPVDWIRNNPVERTVRDIELLDGLSSTTVQASLFELDGELLLRVYQSAKVNLSELMPVLSNLGIQTVDAQGTSVRSRGGNLHVDTFRLVGTRDNLLRHGGLVCEAISRLFDGSLTDDPLNGLILQGLSWRQVDVIRSYARYLRQLPIPLLYNRLTEILLNNPATVKALVDLFEARFDPKLEGDRSAAIERVDEELRETIRLINAQDEDLAFSALRALVLATMRTNYYRGDRPHHYLSFKIEGARVPALGAHPPLYEVFVHARDVEGVHMRFGKVARGGLRWSDRDDYRTEVLGLVTTQRVKNVVIVPTGSKGGFYLKNAPRDSRERRAMADEKYKTFIRGLLDLTDTYEGTSVVPPPGVVRHDGDDPYLVVAADKGTAHLSDTANALSVSYGYWLGDAFASGGSNGYDHKKVGITARGAWVLVRRHFAECGLDPYSTPFTCVGVGDMGGDVFGNGLLETPHGSLLAAFNHLQIFLDPDPDQAAAFDERKRLFACQGGWDQYDVTKISSGGGVFDRRAKEIPLSAEAQAMLGLEQARATPESVIHAILQMEVDLFWNGGIGTYVKASHETHADADDRSNNNVRIDATDLRARIVGEGGNLGLTHAARIEASLRGIRLNNDAIDNSAGVDMSDHEVNIKILLDGVVRRGNLTEPQRNQVLEEMTAEVADLVLADNDANGRQLSRDQLRSSTDIYPFGRAITFIEGYFGRDRESIGLPSEDELEHRARQGLGLSRPELAVLSAWVKMFVTRELLQGDPKRLPGYARLLQDYFPERIRTLYAGDIEEHMLADEIATTVATTRMVADGGATLFPTIIEATGASVGDVAEAYLKAQTLSRADQVRGTLEELRTSVTLDALYRAWVGLDSGTREVAMYWLSAQGSIPNDELVGEMMDAAQQVYDMQAAEVINKNRAAFDELLSNDIPEGVAQRIMRAKYLNIALTVWSESKRTGSPFGEIAVRHLAIGRASRLQEVLDDLSTRPAQGRLGPIALRILHTRFHTLLRTLVGKLPSWTSESVDQLEPDLLTGPLADVRAQVDNLMPADNGRADVATLLVLEERVAAAMGRIDG